MSLKLNLYFSLEFVCCLKVVDSVLSIGRDISNDIVIDDPSVSRHHALLKFNFEVPSVKLEDLSSKNGTYLNNKKIKMGYLYLGDIVSIGYANIIIADEFLSIAELLPLKPPSDRRGHIEFYKWCSS